MHASFKKEYPGAFPGHHNIAGELLQPGSHSDLPRSVPKARDQEGSYFSTANSGPFLRKHVQETSYNESFRLGSQSPPSELHGGPHGRRW